MAGTNKLEFKDKTIIFNRKIGNLEKLNDLTFVLIETTSNLIFPYSNFELDKYRNVLAFDANGNLSWTIEEAPLVKGVDTAGPYSSLFLENGKLCAYHTSGYYYFIDVDQGKITPRENTRPW